MTAEEERRNAAWVQTIRVVPMTCGNVSDVMDYLRDKYKMSDDDYDFAYWMLTSQTKALRNGWIDTILSFEAGNHDRET